MADGCDVRGLMYWTLMDNFEWAFGWAPRFGLFEWDVKEPNQVQHSVPATWLFKGPVSCTANHAQSNASHTSPNQVLWPRLTLSVYYSKLLLSTGQCKGYQCPAPGARFGWTTLVLLLSFFCAD